MRPPITLPYGNQTITFQIPGNNPVKIFEPGHVDACQNPGEAVENALSRPLDTSPLEEIIHPGEECTILVDDHTRITPVSMILPLLLKRLKRLGITENKITILVSNGTHRHSTGEELRQKVGEVYGRYRIIQHDCDDTKHQVFVGITSQGTPVWVNKQVVETDRLFGIGHIDPSTFAGYAGGRKLIVPGVAALETINSNHSLVPLGFRCHANLDVLCRKDINEAGAMVRADLFLNVVLCQDGQISRAFAGSPEAVFREGVSLARQVYEVPYSEPIDIAVTSGFPYDIDYYQACRAIQYSDNAVKSGGSFLLAAPCKDGVGTAEFFQLLSENLHKPDAFLRNIANRNGKVTYNVLGYFLTRIQADKHIYMVSEGISDQEMRSIGITPLHSIEDGLQELIGKYGQNARIGVFPVGSACVPVLRKPTG